MVTTGGPGAAFTANPHSVSITVYSLFIAGWLYMERLFCYNQCYSYCIDCHRHEMTVILSIVIIQLAQSEILWMYAMCYVH